MKKITVLFWILATLTTTAQKQEDLFSIKEKTFRMALKYNDLQVAKQAVFEMMVLKPEMKSLKDSLNIIYFNLGNHRENVMLSNELLEDSKSPSYSTNLEIRAISYQNLGMIKESLQDYEKLHGLSKSIYHLYQIAALQYELKRFGECDLSISKILQSEEAATASITMPIDNRNQQKVLIKAAAFNMRGVLAMETNNLEQAKKSFNEAIALEKDFVLAKNNLEIIEKKNAESKKTTESKPEPSKKSSVQK
ncbi:MAG: hypothetical protein SNJ77_05330 [Cytophagales bacterium]